MIERNLAPVLLASAEHYPVVTVTGPRQSGKTTLCRALFPRHRYISLEAPDVRAYALEDPRGLLHDCREGAIFDEAQHVPGLLSYLQVEVDERSAPGRFVVTGSQHFGLASAVSQTLAGRTAVHHLLPPSYDELVRFPEPPATLDETLFAGAYPRIHDRGIPSARWISDYVATWVQRDVRQVLNVGDLDAFQRFLRLSAARTGCEANLSELGADAGVSHNTARAWLSVLETCFVLHRLSPWQCNLRKRLVKRPKLHFVDSGVVCFLLGIRSAEELRHHPLRGAIFESWVATELLKQLLHRGDPATLHHLRADRGVEVDVIVERGGSMLAVEAKSGMTVVPDHVANLRALRASLEESARPLRLATALVYGGDDRRQVHGVDIVPWRAVQSIRV